MTSKCGIELPSWHWFGRDAIGPNLSRTMELFIQKQIWAKTNIPGSSYRSGFTWLHKRLDKHFSECQNILLRLCDDHWVTRVMEWPFWHWFDLLILRHDRCKSVDLRVPSWSEGLIRDLTNNQSFSLYDWCFMRWALSISRQRGPEQTFLLDTVFICGFYKDFQCITLAHALEVFYVSMAQYVISWNGLQTIKWVNHEFAWSRTTLLLDLFREDNCVISLPCGYLFC